MRNRRLERKLTFTQAAAATKISPATLKWLEKNQFNRLPAFPYLQGMVQNYAKYLKLDPVRAAAVLRRDYDQVRKQTGPVLGRSLEPPRLVAWLEKPQALYLGGLLLAVILVGWSLWQVYQPPRLLVESPVDGQTAISPVEIKGQTDRDASLSVNGKTINLEPDGSFKTEFLAEPGAVELTVRATSRRQKTSEKKITVIIIQ